jgi:hypothetical protein
VEKQKLPTNTVTLVKLVAIQVDVLTTNDWPPHQSSGVVGAVIFMSPVVQ